MASLMCGCPQADNAPPTAPMATAAPAGEPELQIKLVAARRQVIYLPLENLPAAAGKLMVDLPEGDGNEWVVRQLTAYERRDPPAANGSHSGPGVEQLTGQPTHVFDAGSILVPAKAKMAGGTIEIEATDLSRLLLRWEVPPIQSFGPLNVPLRWEFVIAGQRTASQKRGNVELRVSDITLPAERSIHTVATTTMERLAELYPKLFADVQGNALDRADAAQKDAIARLDALVALAQRNGVTLAVENIGPQVRVDEVGKIVVEWEEYDRLVAPWMDGTAFADRLPLDVWVAPMPPKRIQQSPGQVRQYWQACAAHYRRKGWLGAMLLLHPSLLDTADTQGDATAIAGIVTKDMDAQAAAAVVRRLDEKNSVKLLADHPRMWVVDDADMLLPPCGGLATAQSVRAWPWMCQSRGLSGMVWRDALRKPGDDAQPLFAVMDDGTAAPTTRLPWLEAGIADAERFGLFKKRGDPRLADEVLAGAVGRTGTATAWSPQQQPDKLNAFAPATRNAGYLFAAWPADPKTWTDIPGMLDALIEQNAPGQQARPAATDPEVLAAKMWLAQAHRPTARVGAYQFDVAPGPSGAMLTMDVQVGLENPIAQETKFAVKWPRLPGTMTCVTDQPLTAKGYERRWTVVRADGLLSSFGDQPPPVAMEWSERGGGTHFELPVAFPVYAMPMTAARLTIDGKGDDWPLDPRYATYAPMKMETRTANRPQLDAGRMETAELAGSTRWTYDANYVYALINLTQPKVDDQKNGDWPLAENTGGLRRWWGTDGVQVLIAGGSRLADGSRVAHIAVKPGGAVLTRIGTVNGANVDWTEAVPPGLKYGIQTRADGYAVEMAMPRNWFANDASGDPSRQVWRVNVLRHIGAQKLTTSWSGPVLDDADIGMMGLLVGEK